MLKKFCVYFFSLFFLCSFSLHDVSNAECMSSCEEKCEPEELIKNTYAEQMTIQDRSGYFENIDMPSLYLYNSNDPNCDTKTFIFYYFFIYAWRPYPIYLYYTLDSIISNSYVQGVPTQTTIYTAFLDSDRCKYSKKKRGKIILTETNYFDDAGVLKSTKWTARITTNKGSFIKLEGEPIHKN